MMSKIKIYTYQQLINRLTVLNETKQKQESELKTNLSNFYENIKLKNIVKKIVVDLTSDKEFRNDAYRAILLLVTDFIMQKGGEKILLYKDTLIPVVKKYKEKITLFFQNLFSKQNA